MIDADKTTAEYIAEERENIETRLAFTDRRCLARGEDGDMWALGDMRVIWSIDYELDRRPWMHVSASRPTRIPSYADMKRVHALFIGDRYAYSVWAPMAKHVNIHGHALHLWLPLRGLQPLPDFTRGGVSI